MLGYFHLISMHSVYFWTERIAYGKHTPFPYTVLSLSRMLQDIYLASSISQGWPICWDRSCLGWERYLRFDESGMHSFLQLSEREVCWVSWYSQMRDGERWEGWRAPAGIASPLKNAPGSGTTRGSLPGAPKDNLKIVKTLKIGMGMKRDGLWRSGHTEALLWLHQSDSIRQLQKYIRKIPTK
jgi:hypothetical protein